MWFDCYSFDLPFQFVNPLPLSVSQTIPTLLKYWKLQVVTQAGKKVFSEGLQCTPNRPLAVSICSPCTKNKFTTIWLSFSGPLEESFILGGRRLFFFQDLLQSEWESWSVCSSSDHSIKQTDWGLRETETYGNWPVGEEQFPSGPHSFQTERNKRCICRGDAVVYSWDWQQHLEMFQGYRLSSSLAGLSGILLWS